MEYVCGEALGLGSIQGQSIVQPRAPYSGTSVKSWLTTWRSRFFARGALVSGFAKWCCITETEGMTGRLGMTCVLVSTRKYDLYVFIINVVSMSLSFVLVVSVSLGATVLTTCGFMAINLGYRGWIYTSIFDCITYIMSLLLFTFAIKFRIKEPKFW